MNGAPYAAIWYADGGITYAAREGERSRFAIYSASAGDLDDPSRHEELLASPRALIPMSWDSAGRHLVFNELFPVGEWSVRYYDVETGKSHDATDLPHPHSAGGDLSPDDRWHAYHAGSLHAIYVEPFLGWAAPRPESIGDFRALVARWATVDGELYLYYISGGQLDRVRVRLAQDAVSFSEFDTVGLPPDPALAVPIAIGYKLRSYGLPVFNVGPDGTIFILLDHQREQRRISVRVGLPSAAQ